MNDIHAGSSEPSMLGDTTDTVGEVARDVRHAFGEAQTPGQWKAILSDLVREVPLPSLAVAFLLGVIVARR
jgi:hypothetical protein